MWMDCDLVRVELTLLWAKQQLGLFGNLGKSSPGSCKRKVLVPVAGTRSGRWSGAFFGGELEGAGGGLIVCGPPRGVSTECHGISWESHISVLEGEAAEPQQLIRCLALLWKALL